MRSASFLATTTVAVLLSLTACDSVQQAAEDEVRDTANDAACAAAQEAADQAAQAADGVTGSIGANPQAAREDLQAVSDALAVAQVATAGNLNADLTAAKTAIDTLTSEAAAAAAGGVVDTHTVNAAKRQLSSAVADIRGAC